MGYESVMGIFKRAIGIAPRLGRFTFLILPALHLALCILTNDSESEGSWLWFPVFMLDIPVSLLIVGHEDMFGSPLLTFGSLGTLWWLLLGILLQLLLNRTREEDSSLHS